MDPALLTPAFAEFAKAGILGAICLLLMGVAVWAMREKGKAEDALRESDKERVTEAREAGKLVAEISRMMATLASAIEASNRTAAEGNVFRQAIAQAMESLEKAIEDLQRSCEARGRDTSESLREVREGFARLNEEVRRGLPRGPA